MEGTRVPSVGPPLVPIYPFYYSARSDCLVSNQHEHHLQALKEDRGIGWRLSDNLFLESQQRGRCEVEWGSSYRNSRSSSSLQKYFVVSLAFVRMAGSRRHLLLSL